MNPTNDWASSDATQNITLADADQFKNQLAAALVVQFADRFAKTASGEIISETELRRNPLPAAPVNLWGTLGGCWRDSGERRTDADGGSSRGAKQQSGG